MKKLRLIPAVFLGLVLLLGLGYCTHIVRPPRPPFANQYATHPDGRPPWPRWWIHPSYVDGSGSSFRTDHAFNLILLYCAGDPNAYLYGFQVLDEQGQLILWDQDKQRPHLISNTPDLFAARNKLFVLTGDGAWHSFDLPTGFAKTFEQRYVAMMITHHKQHIVPYLTIYARQSGGAVLDTGIEALNLPQPSEHDPPPMTEAQLQLALQPPSIARGPWGLPEWLVLAVLMPVVFLPCLWLALLLLCLRDSWRRPPSPSLDEPRLSKEAIKIAGWHVIGPQSVTWWLLLILLWPMMLIPDRRYGKNCSSERGNRLQ